MLNYAVEDDVGGCAQWSEAACDANMGRFLKSIADCDVSQSRGFMAIKVQPPLRRLRLVRQELRPYLPSGNCRLSLKAFSALVIKVPQHPAQLCVPPGTWWQRVTTGSRTCASRRFTAGSVMPHHVHMSALACPELLQKLKDS